MGALRKIVLTGGPGAGKTTVAHLLAAKPSGPLVVVPEAATQVFRQMRANWRRLDAEGRRDLQRRIFALQRHQEERFEHAYPDKILLLDRGTVDGAAYWPDGPEDYWPNMRTTLEVELARYDAVIHLQTCAALDIYDGPASNPFRSEDRAGAVRYDQAIAALWRNHARFISIPASPDIRQKIAAVREALSRWGCVLRASEIHRADGFAAAHE